MMNRLPLAEPIVFLLLSFPQYTFRAKKTPRSKTKPKGQRTTIAPKASIIPTTPALAVGIAAPVLRAGPVDTLAEGLTVRARDGRTVIWAVTTAEDEGAKVVGGTSMLFLAPRQERRSIVSTKTLDPQMQQIHCLSVFYIKLVSERLYLTVTTPTSPEGLADTASENREVFETEVVCAGEVDCSGVSPSLSVSSPALGVSATTEADANVELGESPTVKELEAGLAVVNEADEDRVAS